MIQNRTNENMMSAQHPIMRTTAGDIENSGDSDDNESNSSSRIACSDPNNDSNNSHGDDVHHRNSNINSSSSINHTDLHLAADYQLCTLLQSMSHHIQSRTIQLSNSLKKLEDKLKIIDYNVDVVTLLDSESSDYSTSMLFRTADNDGDNGYNNCNNNNKKKKNSHNNHNDNVDHDHHDQQDNDEVRTQTLSQNISNNNEKDIHDGLGIMHQEENEAILHGIKALSIFHDHTTTTNNNNYNNNDNVPSGENMDQYSFKEEDIENDDNDDDDSFYYYESSPGDVLNQRPLPFVVGTAEFLESVDGGIGDDL